VELLDHPVVAGIVRPDEVAAAERGREEDRWS
jgi:hypothetical protein